MRWKWEVCTTTIKLPLLHLCCQNRRMRMFRNTLINPMLVLMEAIWDTLHLRRMLLSSTVMGKLRNTVLGLRVLGMRVVMLVPRRLHTTPLLLRLRENLLVDRGEIFEIDVFLSSVTSCIAMAFLGLWKGYGGRMNTRLEEGEEDNVLVRVVFFYSSNYISIRRGFSLLSIHNSNNLTHLPWTLVSSYPAFGLSFQRSLIEPVKTQCEMPVS